MISKASLGFLITLIAACQQASSVRETNYNEITCEAFGILTSLTDPRIDVGINCNDQIALNGRSIVDALRRARYTGHLAEQGISSFNELAPNVTHLHINIVDNITILENGLEAFPNLRQLGLGQSQQVKRDPPGYLDVVPKAFDKLKRQEKPGLRFEYLTFTNNTIQAISAVKNSLDLFVIEKCQPENEVLQLPKKFKKLSTLIIHCKDFTPLRKFDRLAKGLVKIEIENCNLNKISSSMLRDMKNLTSLRLDNDKIAEVEPNAFDDLIKLRSLWMMNNSLTILPDGLFKNTERVELVFLTGNNVENLSLKNFTTRFQALGRFDI